jgi:hypothetical protein
MMAEATTEFRATLEELAASRGLSLEEACERTRPIPPEGINRKVTLGRLESGGFSGCGALLDHVLYFTDEERERVAASWARSVLK